MYRFYNKNIVNATKILRYTKIYSYKKKKNSFIKVQWDTR